MFVQRGKFIMLIFKYVEIAQQALFLTLKSINVNLSKLTISPTLTQLKICHMEVSAKLNGIINIIVLKTVTLI